MFSNSSHYWLWLNLSYLFVCAVSNHSKSKVPHACPGLILCYGGLVFSGRLCLSAAVPYQSPRLTHFCHCRCDVAFWGVCGLLFSCIASILNACLRMTCQKGCQSFCKPTMLCQTCHLGHTDCSIKDNVWPVTSGLDTN